MPGLSIQKIPYNENIKQCLNHLLNPNISIKILQEEGPTKRDGVRGVRAGGAVTEPDGREGLPPPPVLQDQGLPVGADGDRGAGGESLGFSLPTE